jgi:hypothetical protein
MSHKHTLLALLLAWSPAAFAFPPCPIQPVTIRPVGQTVASSSTTDPWFDVTYGIVDSLPPSIQTPAGGKCGSRAIAAESHTYAYDLPAIPDYADKTYFGVLALPDMPELVAAENDLRVQYRFDVVIDANPLVSGGDWLDLAQLELLQSEHTSVTAKKSATYYRLRKHETGRGSRWIDVIEMRNISENVGTDLLPGGTVVARLYQEAAQPFGTKLSLRWTQTAKPPAASSKPLDARQSIDTVFEVLSGSDDKVIYSTTLQGQWVNSLSIGSVNYNVQNALPYAGASAIELDRMYLSAERL